MAEDEFGKRLPASFVLFGSLEAGPAKSFAALGMKRAFGEGGLDYSGFRSMVSLGAAREQTHRRPPRRMAHKLEGQTLVGYEWRFGNSFLALYAGSDFEIEERPCGCGIVAVIRQGQRLQADFWTTPTRQSMVQASAYASTLDGRIWGRLAPGWAPSQGFLKGVYIGPEIEGYRRDDYHKYRFGLHLTGFRLLGLNWRLSGGWQRTSDRPKEAYATLGAYWQR